MMQDMCLQIHIEGMPLLPNRPSCNRYASMLERWDAICRGMSVWKSSLVSWKKQLLTGSKDAEDDVQAFTGV